jgi:ABC-type polysaccharide transport system permease subunit
VPAIIFWAILFTLSPVFGSCLAFMTYFQEKINKIHNSGWSGEPALQSISAGEPALNLPLKSYGMTLVGLAPVQAYGISCPG